LKENIIDNKVAKYFNRKYLKKTIMTFNYSAKERTTLKYFLNDISSDDNMTDELINKVSKDFKKFYKFLEDGYGNNLYEYKLCFFENIPNTIKNNGDEISLAYYHKESHRFEHQLNKKRHSINISMLTEKVDIVSTNNAKRPNIIHNTDSNFARCMLEFKTIHVIHDEFLIPSSKVCQSIDYANRIFPNFLKNTYVIPNDLISNKNYNFFIFL
jgi:hypothetical protein